MREYSDLHAFADGELTDQEVAEIRQELDSNPLTAAEYAAIQNLKDFIRGHARNPKEEEAWQACVKRLNEIDKTRRVESFVGRYAWVLCGIAFVAIVSGGLVNHSRPASSDGTNLSSVMASLGPSRSPANAQPEDLRRWVNLQLGRAREAIDPSRMVIRGVAEGLLDGHRVLRLQMRDASGDLGLVVVDGKVNFAELKALPDPNYQGGRMGDLNCVSWAKGPFTFVLFGHRTHDDLAVVGNRLSSVQP